MTFAAIMTSLSIVMSAFGVLSLALGCLGVWDAIWGVISEEEREAQAKEGLVWLPTPIRDIVQAFIFAAAAFALAALLYWIGAD